MWPYCHSNQTDWLGLLLILLMVKKYRIEIWSGHQRDFDVLLTVHLSIILVINQLNAQILFL